MITPLPARRRWARPAQESTSWSVPSWRLRFGARMTLTLMLTLVVIGVGHYALEAKQLTKRVVEENLGAHLADAAVLHELHKNATDAPWTDVGELLNHVAARPGVRYVAIVAPDSSVAAVGSSGHSAAKAAGSHGSGMAGMNQENPVDQSSMHGSAHQAPPMRGELGTGYVESVRGVLATGKPQGGTLEGSPSEQALFAVPLDFAGQRHVLLVVKDAGLINKQLTDSRWVLLLSLGLALVVALPLFYLLGGRALTTRYSQLLRYSSRDGLTGLGNHRSFHEEIRRAVERARRHGQPLSVAFIDLDHFKQVNDSEGHLRGDAVLIQIADILGQVRIEDRAFRVGGDEFAVLFPATDSGGAQVTAEKVRSLVQSTVDVVTTSIGVAELDLAAPDADSLINRADLAMYQAKHQGKNQVVVYTEPSLDQAAVTS